MPTRILRSSLHHVAYEFGNTVNSCSVFQYYVLHEEVRSSYNRWIKFFFGYKRRDSLTNVLLTLGLPSFDTVLNNAYASFWRLWKRCNSLVVAHFRTLNKSENVQTV